MINALNWLAAAVQPESGIGLPRDASVDGHRIDWLINVTTLFITILFVILVIWMLWACIAHGKHHKAEYDKGTTAHAMNTALIISGLIFLIVDGNLFVNAMVDIDAAFWNFEKPEQSEKVVRVEVNAHQWAWDFRYAGRDGEFNTPDDIVTLNDMRVPVGVPVTMQLASVDVIHSFYLPNMRVKVDATPGHINRLWFQARTTGEFDIGCAQHCGVNHYLMKARLTVTTPEAFAQWTAEMSAEGERRHAEAVRNGSTALFQRQMWGWKWQPTRDF
jgi:cytochrome c oxidase subunit 2